MDPRHFAILTISLGILLRFIVALRGQNYDFNSYRIVADILHQGGNVYAETTRYNYGPIWLLTIRLLDLLTFRNTMVFRYLLTLLLSLVDIGIFVILWQRFGRFVAVLFLFNPIAIVITGYHNQFDNLAIFLGMLAILVINDDFDNGLTTRKFSGLLILGLSLVTKHILFMFSFWLAVKQKGWPQKAAVFLIPLLVFITGFLPYWAEGQVGVIQNVFLYKSYDQEYFYNLFVPGILQAVFDSRMIWMGLLIVFALATRLEEGLRTLLIYTAVLVAASPAITNQYLAIPVAFVSVYLNPFTALYSLVGAWLMLVDEHALHLKPLQLTPKDNIFLYAIMVILLSLGIVWMIWHDRIMAFLQAIIKEIRIQLAGGGQTDI
jgi:hypothetical protein